MERAFCTILHSLKSPRNVGMIVRSHVAFGGRELVVTGQDQPWRFGKRSREFSRKLEKICDIRHIPDAFETLAWVRNNGYFAVAMEIAEKPVYLEDFIFPERIAIVAGSEGEGLPEEFIRACDGVVTIRHTSSVGSLNVAVAASITMHEFRRNFKGISRGIRDETDPS